MRIDNSMKEKILIQLMKNGRKSLRAIAKDLGMSTTTVSKIVKQLEEKNIILGYNATINWPDAGYESTICLQISTTSDANTNAVGTNLKKIDSIQQAFYTTGDASFSAYAVCKNTNEATKVINTIRNMDGVERVVPHIILKMF